MKELLKRFNLNGDNSNIFLNDKNSSLNNQPASNENWSKRTPRHNQKLSTFRQISNVYAALWEVKTMLATYMIVFIVVSYGTITVKFIALRVKLPFCLFLDREGESGFFQNAKIEQAKEGLCYNKEWNRLPHERFKETFIGQKWNTLKNERVVILTELPENSKV